MALLVVVALVIAATPGSRADAQTEALALGPSWTLDAAAGRGMYANAAGIVAVERYDGTHRTQHTWDPATGEQRDLGTEGFTGGISATAVVVNREGYPLGGGPFAVDLDTSAVSPLQGLGGSSTYVRDVNERGIVVGEAVTPGNELHAFAEDLTTGRTWDLAAAGPGASARAVSPSGRWVTGTISQAPYWKAFRIDLDTGAYDEVSDPAGDLSPVDVNDDGLVAVQRFGPAAETTFTWAPPGGLEPVAPPVAFEYPVGLWGDLLLTGHGTVIDLTSGATLDLSDDEVEAVDISEDGLVLLTEFGQPGTVAAQLVRPPAAVRGLSLSNCRALRWDAGPGTGSRAPSGWLVRTPQGTTVAVDEPVFDGPAPTTDRVEYSVVAVDAAGESEAAVVVANGCRPASGPAPTTAPVRVVSPTFTG